MMKGESLKISRTLILVSQCRLLVLKTAEKLGKTSYSDLPGGKVEKNETIEQAAKREVEEETGLNVDERAFEKITTFKYSQDNKDIVEHLFCVVLNDIGRENSIYLNSREHDSYKFCDLDKLDREDFHNQVLEVIEQNRVLMFEIYRRSIEQV